jgi:PAS domain S-box-containing protein
MTDLRKRAEAFLNTNPEETPTVSTADVKKLVHELQVHQVELEMQNEELREAQTELAQSRDAYAELYDFAPVGYLTLDCNGVIVESNQTAAIMLGVGRSRLLRKKFAVFVQRDAQDEWRLFRCSILGDPCPPVASSPPATVELALHRADGTPFAAGLDCRPRPGVTPEDGRLLMVMSDVSARKEAENKVLRPEALARERLREIEDICRNAPVGLCVFDRDLRYVRINERLAEINGIPAAEHIGQRLRDVLLKLAGAVEPELRRALDTGEPRLDVEIVGETPARPGVDRSWLEQWLPIRNDEGRVIGLNIVAEEITERKQAQQQLQRHARELEAFNERMVGRELRMVELKKEVNALCEQLGRPPEYPADFLREHPPVTIPETPNDAAKPPNDAAKPPNDTAKPPMTKKEERP